MRLKAFAIALALCAPCTAQEPQEIIAMDAADAATCATGCAMISAAARAAIAERLRAAAEVEALAKALANELKFYRKQKCA